MTHAVDAAQFGIFGAPPSTGNKGVDALRVSVLAGLQAAQPGVGLTVFGPPGSDRDMAGEPARAFLAVNFSPRAYRPSSLLQLRLATRAGLASVHPVLRRLRRLSGILDISGGDSFTDLYGPRRFRGNTLMKELALELGRPLVLLPQTIGPFRAPESRAKARRLMAGAAQVWTRDSTSQGLVEELLGDAFDPDRHRETMDVAFGLPALAPEEPSVRAELERLSSRGPIVGLNVSGLLYNKPGHEREHFGFRTDYPDLIERLIRALLEQGDASILLLPHVASSYQHDCDRRASETILERLSDEAQGRLSMLPVTSTPMEVKWVVSHCAWVCTTRMHVAIAALSQGVPTAAFSYSDKTEAVFATAGVADRALDPRVSEAPELIEAALEAFHARDADRARLAPVPARARRSLETCFDAIARLGAKG